MCFSCAGQYGEKNGRRLPESRVGYGGTLKPISGSKISQSMVQPAFQTGRPIGMMQPLRCGPVNMSGGFPVGGSGVFRAIGLDQFEQLFDGGA